MTILRTFLATLIVLGCALFPNLCYATAAFEEKSVECCHQEPEEPQHGGDTSCTPCDTLDNGANVAAFRIFSVEAPLAVIDELLIAAMRLALLEAQEQPNTANFEAGEPPTGYQLLVKTSLPVRGPSAVA